MVKTEFVAKKGFEDLFDIISVKKANLDERQEIAIAKAIAEVQGEFAQEKIKLNDMFSMVADQIEVEVPDEPVAEEVVADTATVETTII